MPRLCGLRNTDWFWPSVLGVLVVLGAVAETSADDQPGDKPQPKSVPAAGEPKEKEGAKLAKAVVAGGCFWCTEAVFDEIEGVVSVVSGYSGGEGQQANYRAVSTGQSGHAEVIEITYNPAQLDYETLLEVFFDAHDPTQKNRQGPDVGTQYRSAIFYASDAQRQAAEAKIASDLNSEEKRALSRRGVPPGLLGPQSVRSVRAAEFDAQGDEGSEAAFEAAQAEGWGGEVSGRPQSMLRRSSAIRSSQRWVV